MSDRISEKLAEIQASSPWAGMSKDEFRAFLQGVRTQNDFTPEQKAWMFDANTPASHFFTSIMCLLAHANEATDAMDKLNGSNTAVYLIEASITAEQIDQIKLSWTEEPA